MSEYMGWDCNQQGRYDGVDDLADYWEKPGYCPYLIRVDGRIGGFAMVRPYPGEPARTEIGEFFILRKFHGQGIGRQCAFWLFDAHVGDWLIRVLDGNTGARAFWQRVIDQYTVGAFERTSQVYECPRFGRWPMQFYRFVSRLYSDPSLAGSVVPPLQGGTVKSEKKE